MSFSLLWFRKELPRRNRSQERLKAVTVLKSCLRTCLRNYNFIMNTDYGRTKFSQEHHGLFERSLRSGQAIAGKEGQRAEHSMMNNEQCEVSGLGTNSSGTNVVFHERTIKTVMDQLLKEKLSDQAYDPDICRALCLHLSELIKARVKKLGMERHRLVCNVSIGSNSGQGIFMASRFLWDSSSDNFSTSTFQNSSLFAVASVFGVTKD